MIKRFIELIVKNKFDLGIVFVFVLVGLFTRTVLHIIPNLEFVTAISITAGFVVKNRKLAILVPLLTMLFSDLLIGNTKIFIFTWSGFLVPVLLGFGIRKIKNQNLLKLGLLGGLGGLISTLIFYLWTNFGVVLTTTMYTKDILGLLESYINAIPFIRPQLIGNIILVPLILVSTQLLLSKTNILSFGKKVSLKNNN